MPKPRVTIVVTQRERFALSERSLNALYETADEPFELIYVDGRAPAPVQAMLQRQAAERGFKLIRKEQYLPPNMARNLALPHVRTEYVLFLDNDVVFEQGWLSALIRCADETGADLVTPLVCIGDPDKPQAVRVHFAGGTISVDERADGRWMTDTHVLAETPFQSVRGTLTRSRSDSVEFHAALARMDLIESIGQLDEELRATSEHLDLSLLAAKRGGEVWFEPASVVTYIVGKPLDRDELPFFCLRWSDAWATHSELSFFRKWNFAWDPQLLNGFIRNHRTHGFIPLLRYLEPKFGWRLSQTIYRLLYDHYARKGLRHAPPATRQYIGLNRRARTAARASAEPLVRAIDAPAELPETSSDKSR